MPDAINPFKTLADIRTRTTEGVIGQSGLNHKGLTAELRRMLSSNDWREGAVIQAPAVEAALPYVPAEETLGELAGGLLAPDLVEALDGSATPQRAYRFLKSQRPYAHQLEAWKALSDPGAANSVLVTSGTGSGKTECFLVPVLNDLARQAKESPRKLEGVQAIILYPLNALIASQEERLRTWTAPFKGSVRFALYNGLTPHEEPEGSARRHPESVDNRKALRSSPPPILVTNVTMLEYMLLRPEDAPILAQSQGKLKYIVLDEAHSYVGSQAAEIALLLRRVCLAFGVQPTDVRFVATSATIGGGRDAGRILQTFLADVSGAPKSQVKVVFGHRQKPKLPPLGTPRDLPPAPSFNDYATHPKVRPLLERLYDEPVGWETVEATAKAVGRPPEDLMVGLAAAQSHQNEMLAPMRVHTFHRAISGLWTCLDPACAEGAPPKDWPFGPLAPFRTDACRCGAPAFEIVTCKSCGEPFLDAEEGLDEILRPFSRRTQTDEFSLDAEDDTDSGADDETAVTQPVGYRRLIAWRRFSASTRRFGLAVDPKSGEVLQKSPPTGVLQLDAYDRVTPDECPCCGDMSRDAAEMLRPLRVGAPFILGTATPVLLEDAAHPPEADDPAAWLHGTAPPMGGHQLLSFTDSRQGTARLAAKLQIASERNFVRSVIYHAVQDALTAGYAVDPDAAREIELFRAALAAGPNAAIAALLAEREAKVAGAKPGLPWTQLVEILAARPEIRTWMTAVWSERDDRFLNASTLAEFLLLRELIRRPPRQNSIETLGLAQLRFPEIDAIKDASMPAAFGELGLSAPDWRDFLHILTSHILRARTAVRVDRDTFRWLPSSTMHPREVLFKPSRKAQSWEIVWPDFSRSVMGKIPGSAILLAQATGKSPADPQVRTLFDDVFAAAWTTLSQLTATPGFDSRQLDLKRAVVAPVEIGWVCPITKKIHPVALCGLSPDGAKTLASPPAVAEKVQLPKHPAPYLGNKLGQKPGEARHLIRDWLASDPQISELRERGVWNDISDRLALFSDYFRSAEHSAQQPPSRLRGYERDFKQGAINVLNCSTTMEMGVDIGSVSHVMMTNLPPSIANYRQRIGRAGRRGQPLSMGFTFCKDRPLDRSAFRDPRAYLTNDVRPPQVALNSPIIVQRHVNALLFSQFLASEGANGLKMKAGDFFGCPEGIGAAELDDNPAARLAAWVRRASTMVNLGPMVERLVQGTVLERDDGLFEITAQAVEDAWSRFTQEWRAAQALAVSSKAEAAAATRLKLHLQRLCGDYLLGYLAGRGVLPGHGFPTDVVSLVIRKSSLRANGGEGQEESRRFDSYPQRSLDSALREYAPGSEVVIDGLVHKAAGVTLNWKQPASEDAVKDVQALFWRWQCDKCGESGSTRLRGDDTSPCATCQAEGLQWFEYLQPAGFAVDLREHPHADPDIVTYVAPEPTKVSSAGSRWRALFDPGRGRWRSSPDGTVFYCNSGPQRDGYSICLSCGRAGVEAGVAHKPLLGAGSHCDGSDRPFSIRTGLRLAHEARTDVFEFQPTAWLKKGGAIALAVAFREATAQLLGVETSEIGFATDKRRDVLGAPTYSVFLYDKASGGAGFASQAGDLFPDVIRRALKILDCKEPGCAHGCPACVLVGDLNEEDVAELRRGDALDLVRDRLVSDGAPDPAFHTTEDSRYCDDVFRQIERSLELGGTRALFHFASQFDLSHLESWTGAGFVQRWSQRGKAVTLGIPRETIRGLDDAQKLGLRDLLNRWNVELEEGEGPAYPNGFIMLAEVTTASGQTVQFATSDEVAFACGPTWGLPTVTPIVRGEIAKSMWSGTPIPRTSLERRAGAAVVRIGAELDGNLSAFNKRIAPILKHLLDTIGAPSLETAVGFEYEDRYLRSPLTLRLLLSSLQALRPQKIDLLPVKIRTRPLEPDERASRSLQHDWKREDDRQDVAEGLGQAFRFEIDWSVDDAGHARQLIIRFAGGQRVSILLDQGFGPWRLNLRESPFDFRSWPKDQVARLRSMDTLVSMPRDSSTYFVAELL